MVSDFPYKAILFIICFVLYLVSLYVHLMPFVAKVKHVSAEKKKHSQWNEKNTFYVIDPLPCKQLKYCYF